MGSFALFTNLSQQFPSTAEYYKGQRLENQVWTLYEIAHSHIKPVAGESPGDMQSHSRQLVSCQQK